MSGPFNDHACPSVLSGERLDLTARRPTRDEPARALLERSTSPT